jgi:hypothetical protein
MPIWQLVYYKLKESYVGLNVNVSCPECRHYATKSAQEAFKNEANLQMWERRQHIKLAAAKK